MALSNSLLQDAVLTVANDQQMLDRFGRFLSNSEVGTKAGQQWTDQVLELLTQYTEDQDVYQLFDTIRGITQEYIPDSGVFSEKRWTDRATNRARAIVGNLPADFVPTSILDVGCSEGSITTALKNYYEIPSERVYGIDVRCDTRLENPDFTFLKIETGQPLPFEDNYFDLITASMVLHHVGDTESVVQLLDELHRVMKPGGYIVVSEHDTDRVMNGETVQQIYDWRAGITAYLDLVHAFYDIILSEPQSTTAEQFDSEYEAFYRSALDWVELLQAANFLRYSESRPSGTNIMNRFMLVGHKELEAEYSTVPFEVVSMQDLWNNDELYDIFDSYTKQHPIAASRRGFTERLIEYIEQIAQETSSDEQLYEMARQFVTSNVKNRVRPRFDNRYLRKISEEATVTEQRQRSEGVSQLSSVSVGEGATVSEQRRDDVVNIRANNTTVLYRGLYSKETIEDNYSRQNPGDYLVVVNSNMLPIILFEAYVFADPQSTVQLPAILEETPTAELISNVGYEYVTTKEDAGLTYLVYRKPRTGAQANRVRTVQQHYDEKQTVPIKESRIRYLRTFNNWVKTTLINRYVKPGDLVIDFAGGKGGDILKYSHAGAAELLIVDLSAESIKEAQTRAIELKNSALTVRTLTANITEDIREELRDVMRDRMADVIAIQFALHYTLETWDTFYTALDNMDSLLKVGGYAIITIPDAEVLRKQFENSNEFGNDLYRIKLLESDTDNSPAKYSFYLEDAISDLPEYVVDVEEVQTGVDSLGWQLIENENFADYYRSKNRTVSELELMTKIVQMRPDGTFPQDNWEIAKLYRVLVFQKSQRATTA